MTSEKRAQLEDWESFTNADDSGFKRHVNNKQSNLACISLLLSLSVDGVLVAVEPPLIRLTRQCHFASFFPWPSSARRAQDSLARPPRPSSDARAAVEGASGGGRGASGGAGCARGERAAPPRASKRHLARAENRAAPLARRGTFIPSVGRPLAVQPSGGSGER